MYTAKIKLLKSFVSTVAMNNGNCNLISHVASYDCIVTYNVNVLIKLPIIIPYTMYGLIDLQRSKIHILN